MMRNHGLLGLMGLCALGAAIGGASCGAAPGSGGGQVQCAGTERVALDCTSEVQYQGVSGEAGINVMDLVGAQGTFQERAIRRVSDQIADYVAMQTRACRDYNACILDAEQYRATAEDIRKRIMLVPTLSEALKTAKSENERLKILDQLYRGVVPDDKRVEEITFEMSMNVDIPPTLGGGSFSVAPGGVVPTGADASFSVNASKTAHVYMFQTSPKGEVAVLFPNVKIGTSNPLPAGVTMRIPPPGQRFTVNEQDVGTENVYFVVSQKPVQNLVAALEKVKGGQVTSVKDDRVLARLAAVEPRSVAPAPTASSGCSKTRGLTLVDAEPQPCDRTTRGLELSGDSARAIDASSTTAKAFEPSMVVRTDPGDDVIVQLFSFQHVTVDTFKKSGATGLRRGIVVED